MQKIQFQVGTRATTCLWNEEEKKRKHLQTGANIATYHGSEEKKRGRSPRHEHELLLFPE